MKQNIARTFTSVAFIAALTTSALAADEPKHFSPKGKLPSKYTIEVQRKARETMPFADRQDFEQAKKGACQGREDPARGQCEYTPAARRRLRDVRPDVRDHARHKASSGDSEGQRRSL